MLTIIPKIVCQIKSEDWFVTIDLRDINFRISILPSHRKFLRFAFGGKAFQYWGIRVPNHIDDWLTQAQSKELANIILLLARRPKVSTGLVKGYQPPIYPTLESKVVVPSAHAFVQRCHHMWTRARKTLLQVGACTEAKADRHQSKPPIYVVGQKVWLSTWNIPLRTISNKLAPKFIGPFTVTKIISPVAVRLKLPPVYRRIPPPPRLVDVETTCLVNRILDSRQRGHGFQYLVDWEGYCPEERNWVPARDIPDHSLIYDYNRLEVWERQEAFIGGGVLSRNLFKTGVLLPKLVSVQSRNC
ncbi:hypothetical protein F2P79_017000 [Pimephales promelas]|nr:hypothetical protein F2P79_017000 [Pimephales promelas]